MSGPESYSVLMKKIPQEKSYVWATPLNCSWILKFCQLLRFQMTIWFWQFWLNDHCYCHFFVIFVQNDVLLILVEFYIDWKSPRKSGRNGAHGLNCIIFINTKLIFEINGEKYYMKKFMSLRHFWNFRDFFNFANFGDFKWQFLPNGLKYCHFFVIFVEDNVLFIPVEYI